MHGQAVEHRGGGQLAAQKAEEERWTSPTAAVLSPARARTSEQLRTCAPSTSATTMTSMLPRVDTVITSGLNSQKASDCGAAVTCTWSAGGFRVP